MMRYSGNHIKAGRDLRDPRLVKDLTTLEYNLGVVLDTVRTPATNRARLSFLIGASKRHDQNWSNLMARLDPITTALGNISTQLGQLATQIGELQAGSVSQSEIDAVAQQAQDIADAVDAVIEPDAGEGEPTPEP